MSKNSKNLFLFDQCETNTKNKLTGSPSKLLNKPTSKIRSLSASLDINLNLNRQKPIAATKKSYELKTFDDAFGTSGLKNDFSKYVSSATHKKNYSISTTYNLKTESYNQTSQTSNIRNLYKNYDPIMMSSNSIKSNKLLTATSSERISEKMKSKISTLSEFINTSLVPNVVKPLVSTK